MTLEDEKKLREAIRKTSRIEYSEDYYDTTLSDEHCDIMDKFGFDSLRIIELVLEIEEIFGFEFDMDELDINKVRYYDLLKAKINEGINGGT
jgi:acyl carrier protein